MGLGTNNTTVTTSANFIPALWSDEVVGAYKQNLVLANLVTKMSHKGRRVTLLIFQNLLVALLLLKLPTVK